MNRMEKDEINSLPPQYRPLGAWTYFGLSILFSIPIVGFICLIVFSFSSSNINRRSYARSFFCVWLLVIIVVVIAIVALGGVAGFTALFDKFTN
ncbi:MAG: ABC transporter permease [Clostridia bacterium]|nr:ABC transporter permease [Clostridia bacterium]